MLLICDTCIIISNNNSTNLYFNSSNNGIINGCIITILFITRLIYGFYHENDSHTYHKLWHAYIYLLLYISSLIFLLRVLDSLNPYIYTFKLYIPISTWLFCEIKYLISTIIVHVYDHLTLWQLNTNQFYNQWFII